MKIGIIRGNGIGPEIVEATQKVLLSTGLDLEWEYVPIADEGMEKYGHPLPREAVRQLRDLKIAIKAPLIVDKFEGKLVCRHEDGNEYVYPSLNNAIRRELDLFISVRPSRGLAGISGRYDSIDMVIMREITMDVYYGVEYMIGDDIAQCIKLTTRSGSVDAARYSFEYARQNGRKKVSCIHKANVMGLTDGMFLRCFREVAKDYPDIESDDYMVDAACYLMAKHPEQLDVLCAPNQYGDIMSDLAAGLVGSMGLAPGANIGRDVAVFEAAHGAAPDIAGKGIANPAALILSGAMMLRHIGKTREGELVEKALYEVMGRDGVRTRELGGTAGTAQFSDAVVRKIETIR